jgi:hypothetical protein
VWEPPSCFCDLFLRQSAAHKFSGSSLSQFPVPGWLTGVQIGALALVCRPGMADGGSDWGSGTRLPSWDGRQMQAEPCCDGVRAAERAG